MRHTFHANPRTLNPDFRLPFRTGACARLRSGYLRAMPHRRYPLLVALVLATSVFAASDTSSTAPGEGLPDGLDDAWQQRFAAWGLAPAEDEDGDGGTNLAESIAGTDPRDALDWLRVDAFSLDATTATLTFLGERGKEYRIADADSPGGPWLPVPSAVKISTMDHAADSIAVARSPAELRKFFRLEVRDADGNNDGVSDWAEFRRGTDPATLAALHAEFAVGPLEHAILGETFTGGTRFALDRMIVQDGFVLAGPGEEWPQCTWFFDQPPDLRDGDVCVYWAFKTDPAAGEEEGKLYMYLNFTDVPVLTFPEPARIAFNARSRSFSVFYCDPGWQLPNDPDLHVADPPDWFPDAQTVEKLRLIVHWAGGDTVVATPSWWDRQTQQWRSFFLHGAPEAGPVAMPLSIATHLFGHTTFKSIFFQVVTGSPHLDSVLVTVRPPP